MPMKIWLLFLLQLLILNCSSDISKDFFLLVKKKDKKFVKSDTLQVQISNKKNHIIDSINYFLNKKRIRKNFPLLNVKLGIHMLSAVVYSKGHNFEYNSKITLLSDFKPKLYTYQIINVYPHDKNAYTQGLEFYRDTLFESTGLRGSSSIRKVNFKNGEVIEKKILDMIINLEKYQKKLLKYPFTGEKMCNHYLDLFEDLYKNKNEILNNRKDLRKIKLQDQRKIFNKYYFSKI